MATRPSRSTAQKPTTQTEAPAPNPGGLTEFPAAWGDQSTVVAVSGHNPTDKADLLGEPFLIIGAEFEQNENRDYDVVWVYALDKNGTEFEFSDASSGVREQIRAEFEKREIEASPATGYHTLNPRLLAARGLRVSEFIAVDSETGKKRSAATYYLAGNGRTAA